MAALRGIWVTSMSVRRTIRRTEVVGPHRPSHSQHTGKPHTNVQADPSHGHMNVHGSFPFRPLISSCDDASPCRPPLGGAVHSDGFALLPPSGVLIPSWPVSTTHQGQPTGWHRKDR